MIVLGILTNAVDETNKDLSQVENNLQSRCAESNNFLLHRTGTRTHTSCLSLEPQFLNTWSVPIPGDL